MNERAQFTARMVSISRSIGVAKTRRRLPRQATSLHLERDYARKLLEIVEQTKAALQPLLAELPGLLASASGDRKLDSKVIYFTRYDAGEGKRVRELADRARASMREAVKPADAERLAEVYAKRTADFSKEQLSKQTRAALGVDLFARDQRLGTIMSSFVSENVGLITDIPAKMISDVENTIYRGITKGQLTGDLAKDIEKRFGVSESRAIGIARDQIGKFYGQLNATRQQELGIDKFIWRTMNDDRVREEHEERDGETYSYSDPPDGELPGEPINCRCYAEPVFTDILAGAG